MLVQPINLLQGGVNVQGTRDFPHQFGHLFRAIFLDHKGHHGFAMGVSVEYLLGGAAISAQVPERPQLVGGNGALYSAVLDLAFASMP